MGVSFANAAMLLGLLGVTIPVLIHLLSRRRVPTIPWGAMQFLELGRAARTRIRLAEWLLMAARMLLLVVVALAAARPIWSARVSGGGSGGPRDVVLVVDASARMASQGGGTSPIGEATREADEVLDRLGPGDSAAVVRAGSRVGAVSGPLSTDLERSRGALKELVPPSGGAADLPAALGEAFRILEQQGRNPSAEVVVLTDGSAVPWHLDDLGRWQLLRDLHDRLPTPPGITVRSFPVPPDPGSADGVVLDVRPSRLLVAPGGTITVSATVRNRGPSDLERSAELLVDGEPVPGSTRAVGPVPPGGSVPVEFPATLEAIGPHALSVRLAPGGSPDPLPIGDESSALVEVAEALSVLLVDGEPGLEPMTGEVDFLRVALAPPGESAPQVRTSTIAPEDLAPEALGEARVLILANVDRLAPDGLDAVDALLGREGGVLVLPGDRTDPGAWDRDAFRSGRGWLPARIGPLRGRFVAREPVARPLPSSFSGPVLGPLGRGASPPLGSAALFAWFLLEPPDSSTGDRPAVVAARLDTGDPWLVERPAPGGSGRVAILSGPLDAEGGTLPANADFVPFVRELAFHLAAPGSDSNSESLPRPGDPIAVPIDPPPDLAVSTIPVRTPSGRIASSTLERTPDGVLARLPEAETPGLYRFDLPDGPTFRLVLPAGDPGLDPDPVSDAAPLAPDEADALSDGWPLTFSSPSDPDAPAPSASPAGRSPRPLWRILLLFALAGLCLEVMLTRRLSLRRGPHAFSPRRSDD